MCSRLIKEITINKRSFMIFNRDKPYNLTITYNRRKSQDIIKPWELLLYGEYVLLHMLIPKKFLNEKTRSEHVSLNQGKRIIKDILKGDICMKCGVKAECKKFPKEYMTNNLTSANIKINT